MTGEHVNPEDLDLYALGALEGEEKRALEAHVPSCPACRQMLATAREQVLLLGLSVPPVAPPSAVKLRLMQQVRSESAERERVPAVSPPQRTSARPLWMGFAFACLVFVLIAGWLWTQNQQNRAHIERLQAEMESLRVELQEAQSQDVSAHRVVEELSDVAGAADTIQVTLKPQAGEPFGQARVLYSPRLGQLLYAGRIAPAPADKAYQLWLVPSSGNPVSAGLVASAQRGELRSVRLPEGASAKAFAVTLEPAGGSPQPTGAKVLVGPVGS